MAYLLWFLHQPGKYNLLLQAQSKGMTKQACRGFLAVAVPDKKYPG